MISQFMLLQKNGEGDWVFERNRKKSGSWEGAIKLANIVIISFKRKVWGIQSENIGNWSTLHHFDHTEGGISRVVPIAK